MILFFYENRIEIYIILINLQFFTNSNEKEIMKRETLYLKRTINRMFVRSNPIFLATSVKNLNVSQGQRSQYGDSVFLANMMAYLYIYLYNCQ